MKLKELKYSRIEKVKNPCFLLPIGATEQHGPFLPFGTDTFITDEIISEVEKHLPELIILPTLEYSRSDEHRGFYGTIWLTTDTLVKVLYDIVKALSSKAEFIFVYSFHANDSVIGEFIKQYQTQFTPKIIFLKNYNKDIDLKIQELIKGPADDHAGNTEISNMLSIEEKLVKIPILSDKKNFVEDPFETGNIKDKCKNGVADNHPKWVVSKEIGKQILEIYVASLVGQIRKYLDS